MFTMRKSAHPENMTVCLGPTRHSRFDQRCKKIISRMASGSHVDYTGTMPM